MAWLMIKYVGCRKSALGIELKSFSEAPWHSERLLPAHNNYFRGRFLVAMAVATNNLENVH